MIINNTAQAVQSGGLQEETQVFAIQQNAKMFNLLSDKIYKNKPLAVVRELSCNALDAHVAAGNSDMPIEVHLPNDLEPYFEVKDFGTGLSHEDVMSLYTTYGMSTKDQSNEFIGAMGIGSKSPFAYTQSFTVESRFDGTINTYAAVIDRGQPKITRIVSQDTTEANGLAIKVPVNRNDIQAFQQAAREILSFFPTAPIVVGSPNYEPITLDVKLEHADLYQAVTAKHSYVRTCVYALMGNVRYPIDTNIIKDNSFANSNYIWYIHFDLGELDVASSREELSYDDRTIDNIKAKLDKVRNKLSYNIRRDYVKAKSYFEAMQVYNKSSNVSARILSGTTVHRWRGQPVQSYIAMPKKRSYWKSAVPTVTGFNSRAVNDYKHFKSNRYNSNSRSMNIEDDHLIIYLDTSGKRKVNIDKRIQQYIESLDQADKPSHIWFIKQSGTSAVRFLKSKGVPEELFKDWNDLPEVLKVTSVAKSKTTISGVYKLSNSSYKYTERDHWTEHKDTVDLDKETGYYVDLRDWRLTLINHDDKSVIKTITSHSSTKYVKLLTNLKIIDENATLYGVSGQRKNKFVGHKNWINLIEHADKKLANLLSKTNPARFKRQLIYNAFRYAEPTIRSVKDDVVLPKFLTKLNSMSEEETSNVKSLLNLLHKPLPYTRIEVDILLKKIYKKYPMIEFVRADSYPTNSDGREQAVIDYINLINNNS